MVPNIIIVHPPSTDSGRDAKKFPTGGNKPAMIMQRAPVMIVNLFTTFVIAIRPTFCENDVTGGHPNNDEMDDEKPSQAKEPEISLSVIFLFNPEDTIAVVSPIVSAAETR